MFLVVDRRLGMDYYVFTQLDPRTDGYRGAVTEDVSLEFDMNAIHRWPDGEPRPSPRLGRDPSNPRHYRVFKFPHELEAARFEFVDYNPPIVAYSWLDFRQRFPTFAEATLGMSSDEWLDELDNIDDATKLRHQTDADPEPALGSNRDQIAEWVAKRHLSTDRSIRQVVYLPVGAPLNEIRLLEINERFARAEDQPEPLDFGVEIAGQELKVFVADVTSDQLERLKATPSNLPKGWSLDQAKVWGRRK